ncbi:MAG: DUF3568 family protein [Opitutae bacterium]|nr:DUF3568 family protein [Opitutae bacterium]
MKTTIQTRSRVLAVILSARLLLAATLLATVAFTSGCVAVVAAGAAGGAVAWVRGAVVTSLDGDLDRVYRASQQAVADLQFARISERKSGVDAEIKSRTALDKKVLITLEQAGNTTKVTIRVDLLGDQQLSLSVLDRIKAHL